MECTNLQTKTKPKTTLSFLLPNKLPNKIGVAGVSRSQSARGVRDHHSPTKNSYIGISKRPLSFHRSHQDSPKKPPPVEQNDLYLTTCTLTRRNSVSDSNIYSDSTETTDTSDNNQKFAEKYASHESVFKECKLCGTKLVLCEEIFPFFSKCFTFNTYNKSTTKKLFTRKNWGKLFIRPHRIRSGMSKSGSDHFRWYLEHEWTFTAKV